MWVLSGDGSTLINLDRAKRVFLNTMPDVTMIGADFGGSEKVACIGKYYNVDTARSEIYAIGQALADDKAYFIMDDNRRDAPTARKIMDSRVKRRGGS